MLVEDCAFFFLVDGVGVHIEFEAGFELELERRAVVVEVERVCEERLGFENIPNL